jgi:hypothetical protein
MKKSKKTKVKNKNTNTNKNVNKNNIHIHIGDTKKKSKRKRRKTTTRQQPALTAIYPTAQVIGGGIPQKQIVYPPTNKPEYNVDPIIKREIEPLTTYDRPKTYTEPNFESLSDITFTTQEPLNSSLYNNIDSTSHLMRSNPVSDAFSNQESLHSLIYHEPEHVKSPIYTDESYIPQFDNTSESKEKSLKTDHSEDEVIPFRIITDEYEMNPNESVELDPRVSLRNRIFSSQEPGTSFNYNSILQNAEEVNDDINSHIMPDVNKALKIDKAIENIAKNHTESKKSFFTKMKELADEEERLKAERQKELSDNKARIRIDKELKNIQKAKAEQYARIKELEKNAKEKYPDEKSLVDDIDVLEMLLENKKNDKKTMSQEHLQLYNKVSQNLGSGYNAKLSYKKAYEKLNASDMKQRITNLRPSKPEKVKSGNILGSKVEFTPGGNVHQLNTQFV